MSMDYRNSERRRYENDLHTKEKEIAAVLKVASPSSPKSQQMNEKRVRREIANGNERRRMQCINAGFTALRALIPHLEGEKLSKSTILQHSIDYITTLEKDKSRLQVQLERTSQMLTELRQQDRVLVGSFVANTPPPSKRKKRDTESSDEGVGSLSDASDDCGADLRQRNETLKHQMDEERQRGNSLEEENRSLRNLICLIQKQSTRDQPITVSTIPESNGREVMEVVSPSVNYTPPLHQDEMEYTSSAPPSSFTPDNITMAADSLPQSTISRVQEPIVPSVQMELRDTSMMGFLCTPSPSLATMSSPGSTETSNSTGIEMSHSTSDSSYLHTYAHRDHPRRRRHQAQLERQRVEEEERRQKEEEELQLRLQQHQHQQQVLTSADNSYIPRPSVRSLDILAEAANHVKDDRITRLFEEEQPLQSSHPILIHVSDGSAGRLGGQVEIKCENEERVSPTQSTTIHTTSSHEIIQHISPYVPIIVTSAHLTSENNTFSVGSSFSEKYPIATHLLHRPLHTPFTRPGVIVQKH